MIFSTLDITATNTCSVCVLLERTGVAPKSVFRTWIQFVDSCYSTTDQTNIHFQPISNVESVQS